MHSAFGSRLSLALLLLTSLDLDDCLSQHVYLQLSSLCSVAHITKILYRSLSPATLAIILIIRIILVLLLLASCVQRDNVRTSLVLLQIDSKLAGIHSSLLIRVVRGTGYSPLHHNRSGRTLTTSISNSFQVPRCGQARVRERTFQQSARLRLRLSIHTSSSLRHTIAILHSCLHFHRLILLYLTHRFTPPPIDHQIVPLEITSLTQHMINKSHTFYAYGPRLLRTHNLTTADYFSLPSHTQTYPSRISYFMWPSQKLLYLATVPLVSRYPHRSFEQASNHWLRLPTQVFLQSRLSFLISFSLHRIKIIYIIHRLHNSLITSLSITWWLYTYTFDPYSYPANIFFTPYLLLINLYTIDMYTSIAQLLPSCQMACSRLFTPCTHLITETTPHLTCYFFFHKLHITPYSPRSAFLLSTFTPLSIGQHYQPSKLPLTHYPDHFFHYFTNYYPHTRDLYLSSSLVNCIISHNSFPHLLNQIFIISIQSSQSGIVPKFFQKFHPPHFISPQDQHSALVHHQSTTPTFKIHQTCCPHYRVPSTFLPPSPTCTPGLIDQIQTFNFSTIPADNPLHLTKKIFSLSTAYLPSKPPATSDLPPKSPKFLHLLSPSAHNNRSGPMQTR